jgi:hypothetical protein
VRVSWATIHPMSTFPQRLATEPPPDYPVWPLWFVSAAFVHTRRAGALLILGLLLNVFIPLRLPWT